MKISVVTYTSVDSIGRVTVETHCYANAADAKADSAVVARDGVTAHIRTADLHTKSVFANGKR